MKKDFCMTCGESAPECAIVKLPQKASIDAIVNGENLLDEECLVCHKNAQTLTDQLSINETCDECFLCQATCPAIKIEWDKTKCDHFEPVVFERFDKLAILVKALYPQMTAACEVQVKGNCRTKRIDVVINREKQIYLIKVLSNIDKIPVYSRSYEEVKQYYDEKLDADIKTMCLVPKKKKEQAVKFGYPVVILEELLCLLEEN